MGLAIADIDAVTVSVFLLQSLPDIAQSYTVTHDMTAFLLFIDGKKLQTTILIADSDLAGVFSLSQIPVFKYILDKDHDQQRDDLYIVKVPFNLHIKKNAVLE